MKTSQTTDTVLMVRPAHFQFNAQTAQNNAFQTEVADVQGLAVTEFDQMAQKLRDAGIHVIVMADSPSPVKPDAIFPNNWLTTHPDGTVVLYPMYAPNRRLEVRTDVLEYLEGTLGYEIRQLLDLTGEADRNRFLEGTGSLVLDRVHKVAYACLSPRTDKSLLEEWARRLDYALCVFHARDKHGQDIYHTNVMMSVGHTFAVVCLESVPDAAERSNLVRSLQSTGHEIVEITLEQVYDMAGNMLLLHNTRGVPKLVLSRRAYDVLTPAQTAQLLNHCELLPVDITHIEIAGGGSARCMLAEVFLPRQ
ncbi:MAG: amidinotransferase [Bacteroidetes bacterium]|nr:amidinotransferase [Bacteroidota bacterium]